MKVSISKNLTPNQKNIKSTEEKKNIKSDSKTEASNQIQTKEFSIKTLLDSLFKDLVGGQKSKDMVLQILKDENILQNIKNTALDLKSIIGDLKSNKQLLGTTPPLEKLLLNIDELDTKSLQKYINKSGIFLESKIANSSANPKEVMLDDVKATLLQLKEELGKVQESMVKDTLVKVDKVLTNISYYQLASFSLGANILYLPLLWKQLDEGQISIKKLKQKKYFCEINLKLKDFGKIDLLVMLFDDININISIFAQSDEFLKQIRENLQILKRGISSVGLNISNVNLYDFIRDEKLKKDARDYAKTQHDGIGINLHV